MTVDQILDLLNKGGLLGGAMLIGWGGMTGRLVFGWVYKQDLAYRDTAHAAAIADKDRQITALLAEKDALWQFALKTTGVLDKSLDVGRSSVNAAASSLAHRPPEVGA